MMRCEIHTDTTLYVWSFDFLINPVDAFHAQRWNLAADRIDGTFPTYQIGIDTTLVKESYFGTTRVGMFAVEDAMQRFP
jgi:hypothetical protein